MNPTRLQEAKPSVDELLSSTGELPVLPQVAVKIFEEMRSPDVTAARMAEFIKKDPVLASAVLRVANSALYGGRMNITDLAFAIARVGLSQIRNMLLALVLRSRMVDPATYGDEGLRLMDHSLAVAFAAGLVSETVGVDDGEAFLCGLLHDFGRLALIKALREREGLAGGELPEDVAQLIDELHEEAGAVMAERWGLPRLVAEVARHHHSPSRADAEFRTLAAVVELSDGLARSAGMGRNGEEEVDFKQLEATEMVSIPEAKVEELRGYLPGLIETARSALFG